MHLLARFARTQKALIRLLDNGVLKIAFHIEELSRPYASCIRNIGTGRCRSPMRASCGWPKSMTGTQSSRSIPISRSIANMGPSRSRSFTQRRARVTSHELVDDTSPLANPLKVGLPVIHPH